MCATKRIDDSVNDDDDLEPLAVQSNKLSLQDNRWFVLDTHRHTHTDPRGETMGAQSEGCFMHAYSAYREKDREIERGRMR